MLRGRFYLAKKQIKGGRFLYAYFDQYRASLEEKTYLQNANKKDSYDDKTYRLTH